MQDGFIKTAATSPLLQVANCRYNAEQIIACAQEAAQNGVQLLVTPELGLTGCTCGDLFYQQPLLQSAEEALKTVCEGTRELDMLIFVGLPVRHRGKLYNCAAALTRGQVLGLVPKAYPMNYGDLFELRYFTPGFAEVEHCESGFLRGVPMGLQLLFQCEVLPSLIVGAEIGEDLQVPTPPSVTHVAAGATVIVNLAANSEVVGKASWRRELVTTHSSRLVCAYIYANAGSGESTSDNVFAGHNLLAENGELLTESALFSGETIMCEVDIERLVQERQRATYFPAGATPSGHEVIPFSLCETTTPLCRKVAAMPFVPQNAESLSSHCETMLAIQAKGLEKRLAHVGAKTAVIGISGGLDSTLALLVAARAFRALALPPTHILAVTMPGFGTTQRTRSNAEKLCEMLGVTLKTVDITATTRQHFEDIDHDEKNHNVVFENAQARIRTLILMDLANETGGIVIGTGDLSELALGWATYNGDHMSMYGVNASVPKTLIRFLLAHEAEQQPELQEVLTDILNTPVSPELLPPENGEISQQTEHIVGPYELHDFVLYYVLRWGFSPQKILRLALAAFKTQYDQKTILHWMNVFYRRFFSQQYKRSCLPDGPKVGSLSLSPRGDWHMPSDAHGDSWLAILKELQSEL